MALKIRKAAVLGAGVMGAQIAALLGAAGITTWLLDLEMTEPPKDAKLAKALGSKFRSARAIGALDMLKKLKPSPLLSETAVDLIIPGNFADDLSVLSECDWIIEVVIEKLDIKRSIHKRISEYKRPGVPITTNTSGIPINDIVSELGDDYARDFFGTHFFNPPRYMKLLEVIAGTKTDPELFSQVSEWIERNLGKGVVIANDTVNFIANRVGVLSLQSTLHHMADLKLNFETVDQLTGKLMGRPSSGTLRTMDVVGLDTCMHVAKNVYDKAPTAPLRDLFLPPAWLPQLIESGSLGQKTGDKGCFLKSKDSKGKTEILAYRPELTQYAKQDPQPFPWIGPAEKERNLFKRLTFILDQTDQGAELIWRILRDTFSYSALLCNEIASGEIKRIDDAIRWGFNWEMGPFELWQGLGFDKILDRLKKDKVELPSWIKPGLTFYNPSPDSPAFETMGLAEQFNSKTLKLQKLAAKPYEYTLPNRENSEDKRLIFGNKSASLLDMGDGASLLVFHTKMNAVDADLLSLTQKALTYSSQHFDAMVIGNQGPAFSAGANLKSLLEQIEKKDWTGIDQMLRQFQGTMQLIKYAPFPTVACPHGMTLGGGCEITLHASHRVAYSETYTGLVEVGVGLIPGGGGTKELALRAYDLALLGDKADSFAFIQKNFMLIAMGQVSTSGQNAVEMGLYPKSNTQVTLSRERQLFEAKEVALATYKLSYKTPLPRTGIKVLGDGSINTLRMALYNMLEGRMISAYDAFIGEKVATVLCGGEVDAGTVVDEAWFLDLERRVFVELCQQEKTKERISYMLGNGKALRN
jgi:3-hydroxyacyl-CoA dehydrogenase